MRSFRKLLVCFAALLIFSVSAFADGSGDRFSLFGNAIPLNGGLPPLGSVHLTSNGATFSGIRYEPNKVLTFGGLTQLSTNFRMDGGDCGGGSPRFQVRLDLNGNGISDGGDGNIFIYMGPVPNFTGCVHGWQSTGNLVGNTELRFDLTQVGGAFYDTYANALALHAGTAVLRISVVVDGGWTTPRGQAVDVDNFRVNADIFRGSGYGDDD